MGNEVGPVSGVVIPSRLHKNAFPADPVYEFDVFGLITYHKA